MTGTRTGKLGVTRRDGRPPVTPIWFVLDGDDIVLITVQGMVNRTHVDEIRVVGRNTQGVRVMNLNEGDKVASIAKVAREDAPQTAPGDDVTGATV